MIYNLLDYMGTISNKDAILKSMRILNKKYGSMSDKNLAFTINEKHKKVPRYFSRDYHELESDIGAKYKWVDSGLVTEANEPIILQYCKSGTQWKGALVNTEKGIIDYESRQDNVDYKLVTLNTMPYAVSRHSNSVNVVNTNEDNENNEDNEDIVRVSRHRTSIDVEDIRKFYIELYNKLLIKKDWDVNTNDNLRNYIETLIERLNSKLRKNKDVEEFLIYNEQRDAVVFNTGLLDTFGKSILVVTGLHTENELSYTRVNVVTSKIALVRQGFTKDSLNKDITRVYFYENDSSELIFDGSIEDFDLENWDRLVHCINERRNRFPENFVNATDEVLCQDLIKAIEVGVKLNSYDSNYIKPCYFRRNDSLSFIIPYHVGNNFQKDAELGIVISKYKDTEDFWQVFTILDAKAAHIDIKTLGLYTTESFK